MSNESRPECALDVPRLASWAFRRRDRRYQRPLDGTLRKGQDPLCHKGWCIRAPRGKRPRHRVHSARMSPLPYESCNKCISSGRKAPECKRRGAWTIANCSTSGSEGVTLDHSAGRVRNDLHVQAALARAVKFAEENALPAARRQFSAFDEHNLAGTGKTRLDV